MKYSQHPSILNIMEHVKIEDTFSFNNITSHDRENTIECLDPKHTSHDRENTIECLDPKQVVAENVIPTKMIMETKDIPTVF